MTTVFSLFLLTMLIVVALAIVRSTNLFVAVMLSGIFSFLMAANFFVLDAADVALTEAAVGAGIATVLFLGALALTAETEHSKTGQRWLPLCVSVFAAGIIVYAMASAPLLGDPSAPVHQHVAPWYLSETPRLIDIPNVVTAILASFRGYDTLGEVFVVFTAGVGVLSLLGGDSIGKGRDFLNEASSLKHHQIPRVVGKLLAPFIVLFALYVQFHGEYSAGGGFQAGALLAAGIILFALLEGDERARQVIPAKTLFALAVAGPLIYSGVGVLTMLLGGNFLGYNVLAQNPVDGQHYGIIGIELGVGVAVTGVLLSIFHAFAMRGIR